MIYRSFISGIRIIAILSLYLYAPKLAAEEAGIVPSLYMSVNATDESSDQGRKTAVGESYELGAAAFFDQLGLETFAGRIVFSKTTTGEDQVKTSDLRFKDNVVGAGLRILGKGFSLRVGRAYHRAYAQQKIETASQKNLPNGRDTGNYAGAGLFLPLPGHADITIDYTYFSLPSYHYKVDEVTLGVRYDFGPPHATGGSSSSGGSGGKK